MFAFYQKMVQIKQETRHFSNDISPKNHIYLLSTSLSYNVLYYTLFSLYNLNTNHNLNKLNHYILTEILALLYTKETRVIDINYSDMMKFDASVHG